MYHPSFADKNIFIPVYVNIGVELLQKEAVKLPLALSLLLIQQWAILTGLPAYSDNFNTGRDSLDKLWII